MLNAQMNQGVRRKPDFSPGRDVLVFVEWSYAEVDGAEAVICTM